MDKGRFFSRSARMVGLLLLLAAVLHSTLGTAEVLQAIKVGGIMQSMVRTLINVWIFSSVMLLLSAVWVFFLARDLGRLQRKAWWQAVIISLAYCGGAIGAMVWTGVQAHLIAFALISFVWLIALLIWARVFRSVP